MIRLATFLRVVAFAIVLEFHWAFTAFHYARISLAPPPAECKTPCTRVPSNAVPTVTRRSSSLLSMVAEPIQGPSSATTQVLYQKVVRNLQNLPDVLLLGYLVEYLESHYQIPTGLPMLYEQFPGDEEMRSILAWDSPLSPASEATRMEVEVVGIYTDRKDESSSSSQPSVPKMAMVVVRKTKQPKSSLPPMMENLFKDSEKKIIKALDRGLEDFTAGKIKFKSDAPKARRNVRSMEEAIDIELLDAIPQKKPAKVDASDVVFDAYSTDVDDNGTTVKSAKPSKEQVAAAAATMEVKVQDIMKPETKSDTIKKSDFAVEAAKKKAAAEKRLPKPLEEFAIAAARRVKEKKLQPQSEKSKEDFAVTAARKAAASHKTNKNVAKTEESRSQPEEVPADPTDFKVPDYMGEQRAFRTTISRPGNRREKAIQQATSPLKTMGPASKIRARNMTKKEESQSQSPTTSKAPPIATKIAPSTSTSKTEEKGNTDSSISGVDIGSLSPRSNAVKPMPSNEEIEVEVMKAAQTAMDEFAKDGDITPEQLLKDVLKFGEEKEKENTPGEGFVSAAFDKAKDLMREQHQKHQAKRAGRELGFKDPETIHIRPNIREELSPEEELKRMFEAGERLADGRIIQSEITKDELVQSGTTEADIDALISKDRTISSYARSLDDELSELEVAINNSPGEDLDGPRRNSVFDVMSGPEVYNPNVEQDTINFPGALPGTKQVNIPKDLGEAIQQAEFAVEVLSNLKAVENEDGTTKYTYGKQELSEVQVQQLEFVAAEAIEIGLIKDPVKLVQESSRLQMLVDELQDQPKERFRDISENYKDLLLSDNFVDLIKSRLKKMALRDVDALRRDDESLREPHEREREILGQLVVYAQLLVKEARALGAELETQQLEVIRSICQVAMDPKHQTEEETAMALSDAVRDMRPLLDDTFVAYLKYAVAEEEARLARAGLLDDPDHNQWLFVLKIVQQGVYAEVSKSINRFIDHIWYVLRMETPRERRMLLSNLIDDMPTLDVRPFVKVVGNIVGALGDSTRGEFDEGVSLGEMTNKLLQLHRDVRELLPPERIAEKSRDADEWAARQKERLLEARKLGKERLKAANDVADRQDEIDAIGRRGEMQRFD